MTETETATRDRLALLAFELGLQVGAYARDHKDPGWVPSDFPQVLLDFIEGKIDLHVLASAPSKEAAASILRGVGNARAENHSPHAMPLWQEVFEREEAR